MTPGQQLSDGLTVIAAGQPYRSSLNPAVVCQHFGARDANGQSYSGTAFLDGRYIIHPHPAR